MTPAKRPSVPKGAVCRTAGGAGRRSSSCWSPQASW